MNRVLKSLFTILLMSVYACSSKPRPVVNTKPIYYVVSDEMDVRSAPNIDSKVIETYTLDKQVEVMEFNQDRTWARISEYFEGKIYGLKGKAAKWAPMAQLSDKKKTPKIINVVKVDPRILSVPDEETSGLTKEQIVILLKASQFFLDNGTCKAVDNMDYNQGKWFITCTGASKNTYFNPKDLNLSYP